MPKEKKTPLNEGEAKKGHKQPVKTVPRSIEVREDIHDDFLKLCHFKFTDFTKRVNLLIHRDIEKLKETKPEIFKKETNG